MQKYICGDIINNYGSSELGPCACSHVDEVASIPDAVGKIVPWMDVRITDDHGNELPTGETGQLMFRIKPGRRIAPYLGEPSSSALPADGWFVSGDIGTLTENGILCIQGRASDAINAGGNKIAPSAVEKLVTRFLGATETVCAFGLPDPNGFDQVYVAIDVRNAHRLKELEAYMNRLNPPLGEVRIMAVNSFPLNDSGKISRNRLREMIASPV
jgi:acyl-coenzyme A synthetase/AMP-(fatty) acid ligase